MISVNGSRNRLKLWIDIYRWVKNTLKDLVTYEPPLVMGNAHIHKIITQSQEETSITQRIITVTPVYP